ncbi:hypothetical protein EV144_103645 [Flavobacterium sp. 270]|uniref:hypothetical protein n=1 Tax=Flavobacterium sp. 270 TaxID=2512114 RepID=UPI001064CA67|nr:hypothetical protein [Flavobacterium sp. 270]TDW49118.1 hypothetical protein EV144_103645 [Flavobacterium sp. 270]
MSQDINEILGKKDKIILGTMLVFIFSFVIVLNYFGFFENKLRDEVLDDKFAVTVIDKYIDYKNHATPKVKLSNGLEMVNFFPKNKIQLLVGDSLLKTNNSTDMLVFRNKKLIYSISLLDK